jgi:hypothetical protein
MTTLASLKEALVQPFAVEHIQFLPKAVQQDQKQQWICLALPYANKRIYEDRLNAVAFGLWSTPYTPPYTEGNKLIVPATVIVCDVTHTDYGEAYLTVPSRRGEQHEQENSATEAYSQAFRRACSKFLLGRYLYDLRKLWLPYDVNAKRIAVSEAERLAWVEKLYQEAGLLPRPQTRRRPDLPERSSQSERSTSRASTVSPPAEPPSEREERQLPQSEQSASLIEASGTKPRSAASEVSSDGTPIASSQVATSYPDNVFLDWVAKQVDRDPSRITRICMHYRVQQLCQLTQAQRVDLTRRLKAQQAKQKNTLVPPGLSSAPQDASS